MKRDPETGYVSMPEDVRILGAPWRSVVGEVPGLTVEMEREFRFGQKVVTFNGRTCLGGNVKGGSSAMWCPVEASAEAAYDAWAAREAVPVTDDPAAHRALRDFLDVRGVVLWHGGSGRRRAAEQPDRRLGWVYAFMCEMLEGLPERHTGRSALRGIQIGGWGPDGAKGSAFEAGDVLLYDFAIGGARRTFAGLALHEFGHAHVAALHAAEREVLDTAYRVIRKAGAFVGVEFLIDAEARCLYQGTFFEEFLAETYMIYVSQGERLRRHIARLGPSVRAAWEDTYGVLRETFDGFEYR